MSNYFGKGTKNKLDKIIFERFLQPIIQCFSKTNGEKNIYKIMDQLFDQPARRILDARALRQFKLPGQVVNGSIITPGINRHIVEHNDRLMIRIDLKKTERVIVQVDPDNNGQTYQLNWPEFRFLLPNLEVHDEGELFVAGH